MGALASAAGAHRRLAHRIAGPAQPLGEGRIGVGRPDRQDASRLQSLAGGRQALGVVEPVVARAAQALRAVVDIEQDGVVLAARLVDHPGDIAQAELHAGIVKAFAVEMGHRAARPCDHLGDQLAHRHPGLGPQPLQRGPEGEPHAQAADQQVRGGPPAQPVADQGGQRLFRAVRAAVHQLDAAREDRILRSALHQPQLAPAPRHGGGVDQGPADHRAGPRNVGGRIRLKSRVPSRPQGAARLLHFWRGRPVRPFCHRHHQDADRLGRLLELRIQHRRRPRQVRAPRRAGGAREVEH